MILSFRLDPTEIEPRRYLIENILSISATDKQDVFFNSLKLYPSYEKKRHFSGNFTRMCSTTILAD